MQTAPIIVSLAVLTLLSCSGSSLTGVGGGKSKTESKDPVVEEEAEESVVGDDAADDDGPADTYRAIPPEETNGAYLTCEIFNSGAGDDDTPANVGCNVQKSDGEKLDLSGAEVKWVVADKDGNDLKPAAADVPKALSFHKSFMISHRHIAVGYDPSVTINGKVGEVAEIKRAAGKGAGTCATQTFGDGKLLRVCSKPAALASSFPITVTDIGLGNDIALYSNTYTKLNPETGVCSGVLSESVLTFISDDGDILNFDGSIETGWTESHFCIKFVAKNDPDLVVYVK